MDNRSTLKSMKVRHHVRRAGSTGRPFHIRAGTVGPAWFVFQLMWCCVVIVAAGCQLSVPKITASPYSHDEQVAEVLKIAPVGTDRAEAIRRLEAAGISGGFGISQTIYYCNLWHREAGKRWQMDVALLFDENGKLYDTRHGNTQAATEHVVGKHAANETTHSATNGGSNTSAAAIPTSSMQPTGVRSGLRVPTPDGK